MRSLQEVLLSVAVFTALIAPVSLSGQDVPDSKDHPLLSRMPRYSIRGDRQSDFDSHDFPDKNGKVIAAEGRLTSIRYQIGEGAPMASALQIVRNCQSALTRLGGRVVQESFELGTYGTTTITLTRGGQEIWVEVIAGNRGEIYDVTIVEKAGMKQDVVSADTWRDEIRATGHSAVYGILFDVDKSDIKPELDAALKEIAKLLGQDATLSLIVVGHTDATGDIAYNMRLSESRAKAVVAALTTRLGIAATRLAAYGVGPLAPVASNDTDEGRARNRRVELVRR